MYQAVPAQISMKDAGSAPLHNFFDGKESFLVKQTPRGCCQELLGCEAKSEYKISAMDFEYMRSGGWLKEGATSQPDEMYALEESSFCMRCCWRDGRAMSIHLSAGGEEGGPDIVEYQKPCGCPLSLSIPTDNGSIDCPCCCMLPELNTVTPDGEEINSSHYVCDGYCCVPKFAYMEEDEEIYRVSPATCCGGCCPACRCQRTLSIPFYFHDPESMERITDGQEDEELQPQIRKVWGGLRKECCTTADTFAVFFPRGCDANRKAGLLGLTFLLDFTVFERQGEASGGGE